jgi:hypothetical protein
LDRTLQQLAVIFPVRNEAAIGVSAELASMSGIQGRNRLGEPTEELENFDLVASVTFARRFSNYVSIGGNARYYHKKLETESAYSAGFDLGGLIHLARGVVLPEDQPLDLLRFALVVRNLAAKYPWNTGEYWSKFGYLGTDVENKVPLRVVGGVSALAFRSKLLLAVDVEKSEYQNLKVYSGAEYRLINQASLRAGLSQGRPAFGLGINLALGDADMQVNIAVEKSQHVGGWDTIIGTNLAF